MVPGKLFIGMSTVRPETQQALAEAVRQAGGAFVECPVGGTTGPARSGQLLHGSCDGAPHWPYRALITQRTKKRPYTLRRLIKKTYRLRFCTNALIQGC